MHLQALDVGLSGLCSSSLLLMLFSHSGWLRHDRDSRQPIERAGTTTGGQRCRPATHASGFVGKMASRKSTVSSFNPSRSSHSEAAGSNRFLGRAQLTFVHRCFKAKPFTFRCRAQAVWRLLCPQVLCQTMLAGLRKYLARSGMEFSRVHESPRVPTQSG